MSVDVKLNNCQEKQFVSIAIQKKASGFRIKTAKKLGLIALLFAFLGVLSLPGDSYATDQATFNLTRFNIDTTDLGRITTIGYNAPADVYSDPHVCNNVSTFPAPVGGLGNYWYSYLAPYSLETCGNSNGSVQLGQNGYDFNQFYTTAGFSFPVASHHFGSTFFDVLNSSDSFVYDFTMSSTSDFFAPANGSYFNSTSSYASAWSSSDYFEFVVSDSTYVEHHYPCIHSYLYLNDLYNLHVSCSVSDPSNLHDFMYARLSSSYAGQIYFVSPNGGGTIASSLTPIFTATSSPIFVSLSQFTFSGSSLAYTGDLGDVSADFDTQNALINNHFSDGANASFFGRLINAFRFSVLNPFAPVFDMFSDAQTCQPIPILASMLGVQNPSSFTYCSWFPSSVRNILTPVISGFSVLVVFGFFVSWLKGSSNGVFSDDSTILKGRGR